MNPEDALAWAVTGLVVIIAAVIVIPIVTEILVLVIKMMWMIAAGTIILAGFGLYLIREYVFRPMVNGVRRVLGS